MTNQQVSSIVDSIHQIAVHTQPDIASAEINFALAVGTLLTFIATAFMAVKTAALAKETVRATTLADIHHQESQSGLVIWMGDRRIDFAPEKIVIYGYIANVGEGAATTISISIQGPNEERDINLGVFMPTLAAGQEYPPAMLGESTTAKRQAHLWVFPMQTSPMRDQLLDQGARFKITYYTIFSRKRCSWYPVGGKSSDDTGTHLQYIQEFIELNRDERIAT